MADAAKTDLHAYVLRLADNSLILGQQISAWCGHAPVLEEDIALANVALDLIGQTTNWLNYASELEAGKRTADQLAFMRDEREFNNVLLVEQPNGNFAQTLVRQYLFDAWHYYLLQALSGSSDAQLAEIAQKSIKEVTYHLERSTDLVVRLGDGTQESHDMMQTALDGLWRYTEELTQPDSLDEAMLASGIGPDLGQVKKSFDAHCASTLEMATLVAPDAVHMRHGGKSGIHDEYMGRLLAEMQILPRSYPGAAW